MINPIPKDWAQVNLGDFMSFKNGVNADKSAYGKGTKFVNVMDIFASDFLSEIDIIGSVEVTEKQLKEYSVVYGDILFNRTSETKEDIALTAIYIETQPILFGGFVIRGRQENQLLDPIFSGYCFKAYSLRKELVRRCQGVIRANIGQKDLNKVPIAIPPINEQKKIADILSKWDTVILKTETLIAAKRKQFDWLRQKLLRSSINNIDCTRYNFDDVFETVREINRENKDYEVLSVTKSGIVAQRNYFNKDIASKDRSTYLIVRRGTLVMSGLNFWMGSIDFQNIEDVGIVSPAYKAFNIRTGPFSSDYLRFFIRSRLMLKILIGASVQGASIVRRNLDKSMLYNSVICLPKLDKQEQIADTLVKAEKEIQLLESLLQKYHTQKRGLMQKLLTGEWRVKGTA